MCKIIIDFLWKKHNQSPQKACRQLALASEDVFPGPETANGYRNASTLIMCVWAQAKMIRSWYFRILQTKVKGWTLFTPHLPPKEKQNRRPKQDSSIMKEGRRTPLSGINEYVLAGGWAISSIFNGNAKSLAMLPFLIEHLQFALFCSFTFLCIFHNLRIFWCRAN